MRKLRTDDEVVVIAGRDKGRRGKIISFTNDGRALVAGIHMVKKHVKPNPNAGEQGGIIEKEAPIHLSNLAIFNADSDKGDRVGIKLMDDGKKVRVFKSTQEQIDG